jgi:hypothetical protein
MLLTAPKPTPTKHIIYLIASTILGILLSLLAHALIENSYLDKAIKNGTDVVWYSILGHGQCALPPVVQIGLLLVGAVGGFLIGRIWWRLVYIDRVWSKDKKTNKPK